MQKVLNPESTMNDYQDESYLCDFHTDQLDLLFCGTEKCSPGHAYGPDVRAYFLIVFTHSGQGILRTQDKVFHLGKGSTFVCFPGEITFYKADMHDPWEYTWFALRCPHEGDGSKCYELTQLLLQASVSPQSPVHICREDQQLQLLYRKIMEYCRTGKSAGKIKIISLIWDIIYQYMVTSNHPHEITRSSSYLSGHVSIAIEYIKCYYSQNISIQMIADHVDISREHLCALFKQQYGMSPVKFLRNYRLQNASTLLMSTNYSIDTISDMVGFSDYNYFSNQFRRAYGISPSSYRKNHSLAIMAPTYGKVFDLNDN